MKSVINTINPVMFRLNQCSTRFLRYNGVVTAITKCTSFSSSSSSVIPTALHDFHIENGAKLVNFCNYSLPVQYNDQTITQSHLHTRNACSLFDVSHMLQTEITGKDCVDYFETICTADLKKLNNNTGTLTIFTNQQGGILDDLIVTKIDNDLLFVVSNASMRQQDQKIMLEALEKYKSKNPKCDIELKFFEPNDRSLIAIQGPKSQQILQNYVNINLSELYFMESSIVDVVDCGACRITRCGYTGEDGFEISIPSFRAAAICREIYRNSNGLLKLAGLGARDSLRLEAGLCLYGNDLNATTTPVEAGLTWLIAKRRRELADFPGCSTILQQIKNGIDKKRVGIIMDDKNPPPARQHTLVFDENCNEIGCVTSGCPSPTLNKNIAMAYLTKDYTKIGTIVLLKIRDKYYKAKVTKMPFVPTHYYTKAK